ncbi:MAG: hypothetical protein AB7H77_04005 [Bdellovibrionales bacterium]
MAFVKREPDEDLNAHDPNRTIATLYGVTTQNGRKIGWMRIDHEGSYYDPNTSHTSAVEMDSDSPDITVYKHVWARNWNDPLASSSCHVEVSAEKAAILRGKIALGWSGERLCKPR